MIAVFPSADSSFREAPRAGFSDWTRETVSRDLDIEPVIEAVAEVMNQLNYRKREIFGMRLALHEAIRNSLRHGHRHNPHLQVLVAFQVNADRVLVRVEDEGPGFDVRQVLDPANGEGQPLRGIQMMRSLMSWVQYNPSGNCVTLCKYRMAIPVQWNLDGAKQL